MRITLADAIALRDELDNKIVASTHVPSMHIAIGLSPIAEVLMREAVKDCDERRSRDDD